MKQSILFVLPFGLLACDPAEPTSIVDLREAAGGHALVGVKHQSDGFLLVAEGKGLVEVDEQGAVLRQIAVGQKGLLDMAYKDAAPTEHGTVVLLADDVGFLYDPVTEQQRQHFCVLPGDIVGPMRTQKNDAVDVDGEVIVAAPRFYEDDGGGERLVGSELRTYRLSTGEPLDVAPIEGDPVELSGVARDGDLFLGVHGDRALWLRPDGTRAAERALAGVEAAAGVSVLGDQIAVLDGADDEVVLFDRDALLR